MTPDTWLLPCHRGSSSDDVHRQLCGIHGEACVAAGAEGKGVFMVPEFFHTFARYLGLGPFVLVELPVSDSRISLRACSFRGFSRSCKRVEGYYRWVWVEFLIGDRFTWCFSPKFCGVICSIFLTFFRINECRFRRVIARSECFDRDLLSFQLLDIDGS